MKQNNEIIHWWLKETDIRVVMVADVHLGAIEHDKKAWESFLDWVKANEDVYIILGGDLINNATTSSVSNTYTEVIRPMDQKTIMTDYLRPIKDRILCAVSGNHENRSLRDVDQDITYDIMARLGLEDYYRTNIAYLNIRLGMRSNAKKAETSWNFVVTHGCSNGILAGSGINKNEKFAAGIDGADFILTAHTHKPSFTRLARVVFDSRYDFVNQNNEVALITTCSWLGYSSYAARKQYTPVPMGKPPIIRLFGRHEGKKYEVTM